MNKSFAKRNRLALAYLSLAKDKMFQKLPEGKKLELVQEVMGLGDEAALMVKTEYQSSDPRKIAVKMGLRVLGEEKGGLAKSEYRREKKAIVVSRKFHEKLLQRIQSKELSDRLLKLLVAKELFRHLELERLGEVDKKYRFIYWQWGPLKVDRTIPGLGQVAAQAFTQTLLGLEITPQIFDYLILAFF